MSLHDQLRELNACLEAVDWVGDQPLAEAWATCDRGDWMLWFAARTGIDRKVLVRAACACARQSLQYVPAGEDRPRITIETAEAWCEGRAMIEEVAAYAASSAADAAAARRNSLKTLADIVRQFITVEMLEVTP